MTATPTDADVAQWMADQVRSKPFLYQETAAHMIKTKFGRQFIYQNANFNSAISKGVLKEFRKLTADDVIWDRSEKAWRKRRPKDKSSRQQD